MSVNVNLDFAFVNFSVHERQTPKKQIVYNPKSHRGQHGCASLGNEFCFRPASRPPASQPEGIKGGSSLLKNSQSNIHIGHKETKSHSCRTRVSRQCTNGIVLYLFSIFHWTTSFLALKRQLQQSGTNPASYSKQRARAQASSRTDMDEPSISAPCSPLATLGPIRCSRNFGKCCTDMKIIHSDNWSQLKLLIVDDEKINRMILEVVLTNSQELRQIEFQIYQVSTHKHIGEEPEKGDLLACFFPQATRSEEVLNLINEKGLDFFDVIVMDEHLGDTSAKGSQLTSHLREQVRYQDGCNVLQDRASQNRALRLMLVSTYTSVPAKFCLNLML
jgi:CheY-like chemotaxis protein